MVESVNRYGVLPDETEATPSRPTDVPVPVAKPDPAIVNPAHVESDSDDSINPVAKASPPTPADPSHSRSVPSITNETPLLDPARVDPRNRPWPPCDDRELVQVPTVVEDHCEEDEPHS